ncbi:hypothetical protein CFP65_0915 [Kitasatospora sp. MMS16-BH015]|uniref:hypothetical protein n=1 Tax=Kitasatospora sp. MMS16-BH015 TaxID=2018025 RepID=UPI000CA09D90|nr:hypothetical protein [Kitasatospora sp. MMS16-BH015]AUG75836.1 hypothetical protein CFP65_0915 [Kitasatospora sp. MMS16-BH015]
MKRRAVLPTAVRSVAGGPAAVLAALLLAVGPGAGPAFAEPGAEEQPAAQAFDGETPIADAPAVARGCGQAYGCEFRLIPGLSRELTTAVSSVGNGVINCTDEAITVHRTVVLESSTTDNIAGEISGSATIEGTIDNTTDVTGSAGISNTTSGSHTDSTAPKDKGPNADIANGGSVNVAGTVTGAGQLKLSAKASFTLAFAARYSHEWKRTATETTQVMFTVKSGDQLQFGVLNAMTRTVGDLLVQGAAKLIKGVVVDSPSSVNVSTVVAQTFTNKSACLSLRPTKAAANGLLEVPPSSVPAGVGERYRLGADGSWAAFPASGR